MKKSFLLATLLLGAIVTARAELTWLTDPAAAQEQAAKENKTVLVNFTGSDWCGFCIKLKKEVFNTKDFESFANQNLVLVEIDFPRKGNQTDEQKAANKALAKKYDVRGYPTILVLNKDGKKLGDIVGYGGGGPAAYIEELKSAMKK